MKPVDVGFGAVGFEPSSAADQVGALDLSRLRSLGISERVISMYVAYRDLHYPNAGGRTQEHAEPTSMPATVHAASR